MGSSSRLPLVRSLSGGCLRSTGRDSVKAAFVLRGDLLAYWLDYLFRSRKGHYYRKRYPALSVV